MVRRYGFILLFVFGAGCAHRSTTSARLATHPAPTADGWILSTKDSATTAPALLWNGLIGVRVGRTGGGLDYDGNPLGFYMIDEYQKDGEEKILPMPNPILVTWTIANELFNAQDKDTHNFLKSEGTPLDPRRGTDYLQSLDMRTGVLTTSWAQSVNGTDALLRCETVVHPLERVLAQRWTLASSKPTSFSIKTLDYGGPNDVQESLGTDTDGTISLSASPSRVVAMRTRLLGANAGALSRAGGFRIQEGTTIAGKPTVYERVVSFGPHSVRPLPHFTAANMADLKAHTPKLYEFGDVLAAARRFWDKRWQTDIVIDGPVEDQAAVRSFLFYLRSAINPEVKRSISPFGLSDSRYNGHVFWDADIWVFPALSLIDPKEAAAISAYRVDRAPQALTNFTNWFREGAPTGYGPQRKPSASGFTPRGLKFPWESSVTGRETCPGPSRDEDHITGSVIWSLTQSAELGLTPVPTIDGLSATAANTYLSMATPSKAGTLSILGVMSPDENHVGDDDLYTNLLAQWLANGRQWNPHPSPSFVLPKDSLSLLTYSGDSVRAYKQAAAILSIYPLQYPEAEAEAKAMMDRFPGKVIKNGPAMSDSLNALIWARMGDYRAYDAWKKSWQDFTQSPFLLFSEKRSSAQAYFTTGAAGSLQAVLYGFLGFRIDLKSPPGAIWTRKILGGSVLSVRPNLPSQWRSVTLKNFSVLGNSYTLSATHSNSSVSVSKGV